MSDGLKLLTAAIATGAVSALIAIPQEMWEGNEVNAIDFARQHYRQHRALPSVRTVNEEVGIRLPAAPEPISFYVDKVYERHQYNVIRDRFADLREGIAAMNMPRVSGIVHDMHRSLRIRRSNGSHVMRIDEAAGLVDDRIQSTIGYGGITGVETGWPTYDSITGGYQDTDIITLVGRMGTGKCMDPTTPVILYSGRTVPIGSLKTGDKLMGPDSRPRRVLSTVRGRDPMYRVTPARGESFVCNGAHVLVLACDFDLNQEFRAGSTHLISVDEYLALPSRARNILRVVRSSVEFQYQQTEVSPYYVGIWLGDGCVANGRISTIDPEVRQAVNEEAERFGLRVVQCEAREGFCPQYAPTGVKGRENQILEFFRTHCIEGKEKSAPTHYLRNSREVRLEMLAGIIDSDGHLMQPGNRFEVATKFFSLAEDIKFLARSLGFQVSHSVKTVNGVDYQRLYITGDLHLIPTRIPRKQAKEMPRRSNILHVPFTVESLGEGEYAGITLDGDHLYLLGDFTVTHNTYVLLQQAKVAHQLGHNVLFVTTEMGIEQIARRHAALSIGINPTLLRKNTISSFVQRRIRAFYRDMVGAERFNIFSLGMAPTISAVEALMQEYMPTVVYIDGVYLMRPTSVGKNMNRTERVSAVFDELKALGLESNVPIINTTQFNRQAGKGGNEGSLENIGYSDAIGTHSSIVVAIQTGPTDDPHKSRFLSFLKGREGEYGKVAVNFKFTPIDMSELDAAEFSRRARGAATSEDRASSVDWMV